LGLSLKSLLPAIGAAVGLAIPGGSALYAALGSGIGTLVGGGDAGDAIKNALLAGGTSKLFPGIGEGIQSLAGTTASAAGQTVASEVAKDVGTKAVADAATKEVVKEVAEKSFLDSLMSNNGLLLGGGLAALLAEEPEGAELTDLQRRQLETGERVPDYKGNAGPVLVDPLTGEYLYDSSDRQEALAMLRERENEMIRRRNEGLPALAAEGGFIPSFNLGGFVQGPGTGTSDSIKAQIYQNGVPVQQARLSDEEFVMTKKAVKGAGNGDTGKGAAKMYAMMQQFEGMA
jgi:hypothetical protein